MTKKRNFLSMICRCTGRGNSSHTVSGPKWLLSRNTAPCAAIPSTSMRSRKSKKWQATKLASVIR